MFHPGATCSSHGEKGRPRSLAKLHNLVAEDVQSVSKPPEELKEHVTYCRDAVATCPTHAERKIMIKTAAMTVVPALLLVAL